MSLLLWLFGLALGGVAVPRIIGVDGNHHLVAVLALTPYLALFGAGLTLLALLLRRRFLAAVVALLALSLGVLLLPRYLSGEQPTADGERVRIMSTNQHLGTADLATIGRLVRDSKVDVLILPELTHRQVAALDTELAEVLPYRVLDPGLGAEGSGMMSRYPLRQLALAGETTLSQPSAVVDLPGREDIEVLAVHVPPPLSRSRLLTWQHELTGLPSPSAARVRVLAGDFNATFDHGAFRAVVDRGYADAAEQTGEGLEPTWRDWPPWAPVTLDHVLVDRRCAVAWYARYQVPGSDHDAVLAELVLP